MQTTIIVIELLLEMCYDGQPKYESVDACTRAVKFNGPGSVSHFTRPYLISRLSLVSIHFSFNDTN